MRRVLVCHVLELLNIHSFAYDDDVSNPNLLKFMNQNRVVVSKPILDDLQAHITYFKDKLGVILTKTLTAMIETTLTFIRFQKQCGRFF